jgi:hypothetical protein
MIRTNEQQAALFKLQSSLPPEMLTLATDWANELADIPEGKELGRFVDDIAISIYRDVLQQERPPTLSENPVMGTETAVNNLGFLLMLLCRHHNPEESETFQRGMVFAFVELLKARMMKSN